MCTGHSPACLHLIPLFARQSSQATAVAHARADAVVPAASKAFSPDSSAARSSPGYLLNSANCRDPVLIYRVATHGQPSGKVKPRDSHLTAVHSLADVLELNPVLASTAAAMQLPTRTKVRALARALSATRCALDTFIFRKCFEKSNFYRRIPTTARAARWPSTTCASAADRISAADRRVRRAYAVRDAAAVRRVRWFACLDE